MTKPKLIEVGQRVIFIRAVGTDVKAVKGRVTEHDASEYMTTFYGWDGHTYTVPTVRLDICNENWHIVGYVNGRGEISYLDSNPNDPLYKDS